MQSYELLVVFFFEFVIKILFVNLKKKIFNIKQINKKGFEIERVLSKAGGELWNHACGAEFEAK